MTPEIETAIDAYVDLLNAKRAEYEAADGYVQGIVHEVHSVGPKYTRIRSYYHGTHPQSMVHSFVENETGDLLKAAGWKAPVKNGAAYNLLTDAEFLASIPARQIMFGSYLYKDTARSLRAAYEKAAEEASA